MIKLLFGTIVAAVAMFLAGFLYFAGPTAPLGYAAAGEQQSAVLQEALKANLPATGTYMIPNQATQTGTILYGNGPVATVQYNSSGFPLDSADGMVWGFVLYLIVAALMAGALSQLDRRVPDFKSRAVIVVCFALAGSALTILTDPIFLHTDWTYAIFSFVGSVFIFSVGGLILARWFLPKAAELVPVSVAQKVEEVRGGEKVPPVDSARL